jgi:hypothetical protein
MILSEIKKTIALCLPLLLFCLCANAQSSVQDVRVEFKLDDAVTANNPSNVPDVIFNIEAGDLSHVQTVLISLGSTENGTEYLSYTINMDGTSLPQGVTINVQGNKIIINTGARSGIIGYYGKVKFINEDGTLSEEKTVSNVQ